MRVVDPDWTWTGPPIPDCQVPVHGALPGRDGRTWVQLPTAHDIVENEDHDPNDPRSQPVIVRILVAQRRLRA